MKKIVLISGIILALIILVLVVNFSGYWTFLNWPLNKLIAQTPDGSCYLNTDCKIAPTTCGVCDCGQAVNKNWQAYCPFKNNQRILCKTCPSYQAICRKGACRSEIAVQNTETINDESVPIAPKDVFDWYTGKNYLGQKFRFQGCLEPHTCSGPISSNQQCDINHLDICCDCIRIGTQCPIVALEAVAKEKLIEIRKTEATKYNVEVVGTVTVGTRMRPIQIEATDLKILGDCPAQK